MRNPIDDEAKAYAEFDEKVKRTLLIDNLSHHVTAQMLKSALSQFGIIISVKFIPNYIILQDIPQAALVEMKNKHQAEYIVNLIKKQPFMLCGIPRPVRAEFAKHANFADRPKRPGKSITVEWLKPNHPNFDVAKKLKNIVKKHDAESSALLKVITKLPTIKPQSIDWLMF